MVHLIYLCASQVSRCAGLDMYQNNQARRYLPVLDAPKTIKPVEIGDNVILFGRLAIMLVIRIGIGGVVAYGSVVTIDLDDFYLLTGVPARQIGARE